MQVFRKYMNYIKDFLENTPEDIYEFSIILEDALVDEYDAMHAEQPRATEILAEETPDICASAVATTSQYGRWYFCTRFQEVIQ